MIHHGELLNIFFYPHFANIQTTKEGSPWLYKELDGREIELEELSWNGTLDSAKRIQEPSIIRASSLITCSEKDLAEICAKNGHFLFYDVYHILPSGIIFGEPAKLALREWLDKHAH